MLNWRRKRSPPAPASAPASAKVKEIVRLTLMPIIAEASRSCDVARIALPWRVEVTSHVSATSTGTVMRTTASLFHWYETPANEKASDLGMSRGT